MFDEPEEAPKEDPTDPSARAKEKADELRMHAELFAVFEGCRKFEAQLLTGLNRETARHVQQTVARLEKAKTSGNPILPPASMDDASAILKYPETNDLSTNDYHVHRRPGEVMIVRWLAGEEVDTFYDRLQAHFDAAIGAYREEERTSSEWKKDPKADKYVAALEKVKENMPERFMRSAIRKHKVFVLSTTIADEMNIQYLCDYIMSVPVEELVGEASAPPADPRERDLAWFFKMFALRGMDDGVERMCFFTFLQKADDTFDLE